MMRPLFVAFAATLLIHPSGSAQQGGDPSRLRVSLPSAYLSGYRRDLKGEVLDYHSPVPTVTTSLLVRSEDRARSIAWESQAVPTDVRGAEATFVLMVGIDVNARPRRFDVRVGGRDVFSFHNPTRAAEGDTLHWGGPGGVKADFRVTLIDRYGDAMGFLFLTLPRGLWEPGRPVRFEVLGESAGERTWFMVFRDPVSPSMEVHNAPAVLRTPQGEAQIVRVDILQLGDAQRFTLRSPLGSKDTTLAMGHTRLTLPVPAVTAPRPVTLGVRVGAFRQQVHYTVVPPRRMEVYLLHQTHVDIGYTERQDSVERIQWSNLEEALKLGEASRDFPPGDRFVWNPESIWPVDTYVRAHPGEKTERLMEGIRAGWIELDGLYANLLTGLCSDETLLHAFDASRRLAAMSGVPIRSEMLSDIPGFSWGLVHALAVNGIRYLSIGPNSGDHIGHYLEELGDRPFWWEGPDGEGPVLTWVSGAGYSLFHTGLGYEHIKTRLDEDKVFGYLDQLAAEGFPYDMVYLRYNIGSDNGPPDPTLAQAVLDWNRRYASPVLHISGTTEFFQKFEKRYGAGLPTLRGDMTGYWEDGAASSARETALTRRTAESLSQTEVLARMRGVTLDSAALAEAWRQVLLFDEHTWGSWNSVSEPTSALTLASWATKRGYADTAAALAARLRTEALGRARGSPGQVGRDAPASKTATSPTVEVYNTLPWSRTDLVVLSPEASRAGDRVREAGGKPVPSQRLSTGELAFLARDVPASGMKRYQVEPGPPPRGAGTEGAGPGASGRAAGGAGTSVSGAPEGSGGRDVHALVLSTSTYRVELGGDEGTILSLVHRPDGREWVDASKGGLDRYVYVPGRDPATREGAHGATLRWKEQGPLVWSAEVTRSAPGLRAPAVTEVTLVEGVDRVEIKDRIAKKWVLDPEAVLFRFPFAVAHPRVTIDVPFGTYQPETGQLPGSSKNYFSVQRWVDISNDDGGVTVTTIDAPLIQLGDIHTDAMVTGWLDRAEPSAILYSYVMNNYWQTNYRAAQDDEVTFRYTLRVHGWFSKEEAERFGREDAQPLVVRTVR